MKLIKIAEILKMSKERVGHVLNEYLGMRKLYSKKLPRESTIDQKNNELMFLSSFYSCSVVVNQNFVSICDSG